MEIPLQEHIEKMLVELDKRYTSEFLHIKENVVTARTESQTALDKLERDKKEKDGELNDVRHRFIPREVYENDKAEQAKKMRNAMIFMFVEALAIIALGLSLIGLLMRDAKV